MTPYFGQSPNTPVYALLTMFIAHALYVYVGFNFVLIYFGLGYLLVLWFDWDRKFINYKRRIGWKKSLCRYIIGSMFATLLWPAYILSNMEN